MSRNFLNLCLLFSLFLLPVLPSQAQSGSDLVVSSGKLASQLSSEFTKNPDNISQLKIRIKPKKGLLNRVENSFGSAFKNTIVQKDKLEKSVSQNPTLVYKFNSINNLRFALERALLNPDVEYAQPVYKFFPTSANAVGDYFPISNTSFLSEQWNLHGKNSSFDPQNPTADIHSSHIRASGGWNYLGFRYNVDCGNANTESLQCGGLNTIKVAIIDTGINTTVPDFSANTFDTDNALRFYGSNDCAGTGGQNWSTGVCRQTGLSVPAISDDSGHGTSVAGTIAMNDNNLGGVGIAHNVKILPVALNGDGWDESTIAEGINWSVQRGAKVINLSMAGTGDSYYMREAINQATAAGVIVVAASGNCGVGGGSDCNNTTNPTMFPASMPNVIAVGASNYSVSTGGITRSSYSSFGNYVDVVAPVGQGDVGTGRGVFVPCGFVGTGPWGSPNCIGKTTSDYHFVVGTSFAAPQVSGAIALLAGTVPNLTFDKVLQILANSSTDIGTIGRDDQFGYGLLNLEDLLYLFPDVPRSHPFAQYIYKLRDARVVGGFADGYFHPSDNVTRGQMAKFVRKGFFGNLVVTPITDPSCTGFVDVDTNYPFYDDITTLKCKGVISGYLLPDGSTVFRPEELVTRGAAMKFVINGARIAKNDMTILPIDPNKPLFSDVSTNHVFYTYIQAGYSNGIVSGSNGKFSPEDVNIRGGMSKMISNTKDQVGL